MISGTIQIVFAICLVIILFIIGFATYNYEFMKAIQESSNSVLQKNVPIFEGIKDINNTVSETYTVSDKKDPSYRDIQPSVNQKGGIEFSYSFWLFNDINAPTQSDVAIAPDEGHDNKKEVILFVKGSNTQFKFKNICNVDKTDYKIKCPLVKLEQGRSQLTVEFNTLSNDTDGSNYPEAIKQGARNKCNESLTDWNKSNSHKLTVGKLDRSEFDKKWVLVTIVIKDTVPADSLPYRNKAHCAIYLNNFMELDTYVDGALYDGVKPNISTVKTNKGNCYVYPDIPTGTDVILAKTLMMANLTYYNYAIDQKIIEGIYSSGVPKHNAASVANNANYDDVLEVSNLYSESLTSVNEIAKIKLPSSE